MQFTRKEFVELATLGSLSSFSLLSTPFSLLNIFDTPSDKSIGFTSADMNSEVEPNMLGSYGPWADGLYGNQPGEYSFRNNRWNDVESWKTAAKERVSELIVRPDTGETPEVSVISTHTYDGLIIEELSWQLPFGPPTAAYFVKPQGEGPFPGIIAMHDHGGNKYFGRRKIVRLHDMHPLMIDHQQNSYGGRALANELAKRGFAVLVPDVFTFASRRVLLQDVHPRIRNGVQDVSSSENPGEIDAYNSWARDHEHILAKSLFSAGTTWPGVFLAEDQRSLDVLASRPEVDAENLGCIGLSGGGLRTVMLTGMDSRIKAGVAAGMVSTWRDYLMYHSFTHTWMIYIPHLPRYLDYSEIFGLNLSACLVLNNSSDQIFDLDEMKQAEQYLSDVYEKAGETEKFKAEYYPGNHKFDGPMQDSAYKWMQKWLT